MKLSRFIIVKLTIFLIIGICLGFYRPIPFLWSALSSSILLCLLFLLYWINLSRFKPSIGFGMVAVLLTVSIGILSVHVHNQKLQSTHYSHIKAPVKQITFKISYVLKSNTYYDKYKIEILKINGLPVTGTSLLNVQRDSLQKVLDIDDIYVTTNAFKDILPPLNPNQFNYKSYLERQYIYHQITTTQKHLFHLPSEPSTLSGLAHRINTFVNSKLKTYLFGTDELAVINALLLGQRQDISETLYTNYTKAGAVHILAISGLHVGILLLILNYILSPLERLTYGRGLKTILVIILMWCFAILTGLSPSVSRATLMFTLVAISLNWNRPNNTFNTVAISAFLLLLWNPMLLFDVGFQLSYLAVLSIVALQPKLNRLWFPKYKLINLLWNTLTVTVAAQIGVLPLSIYYFHQFPGLFFLSNLIIIPFLGFILGFGILILLMATLGILPKVIAILFNKVIGFMNTIIQWIANQDQFIYSAISIKLNTVIALYVLIIGFIYVLFTPKYKSIVVTLIACIILQCTLLYNRVAINATEWIMFHKTRETILTHRIDRQLDIFTATDSTLSLHTYPLKDYAISKGIETAQTKPLKAVYSINNKNILIVDSLGAYNVRSFNPYYVLLSNSPQINLNRLIDSLRPKEIIADGSNYKSYIARWEQTCKNKKIPFYQTGKKGAYIFK
ncbi:ComEC/Rec2 family competence protein [Formosa sp. 3Alg 14/1]|uniref:ComEC/Rec2 family competence protein n=1 Tax=Formosa sp. 3Alg 14/1 TaxID=3382190 RepID=UPI0039BEB9C3